MTEVQMPGCSGEGDGEIKVNITKELMKSYILFKLKIHYLFFCRPPVCLKYRCLAVLEKA